MTQREIYLRQNIKDAEKAMKNAKQDKERLEKQIEELETKIKSYEKAIIQDQSVVVTVKYLIETIWNKYYPEWEGKAQGPTDDNYYEYLIADISCICNDVKFQLNETINDIADIIKKTYYGDEIMKHINWDKIRREAMVYRDFETALKDVKKGYELSGILHYSLNEYAISELARLHKASKHRAKIEQLLTDMNYHDEYCAFREKNYEEYIK